MLGATYTKRSFNRNYTTQLLYKIFNFVNHTVRAFESIHLKVLVYFSIRPTFSILYRHFTKTFTLSIIETLLFK